MRKYETIIINDFLTKEIVTTVKEEDYLKVVEEKERHLTDLKTMSVICNEQRLELKEKDEEIKRLKKEWEDAPYYNWVRSDNHKRIIKGKDEEIERLYKLNRGYLAENVKLKNNSEYEELWTLKYIYDVDGVVKECEQNGMLKEDAEELIGMDSDNWNHWSLTKEERPNKDKIIEGLLIRCESNEELIKELESRNEKLANELYKLKK